MKFQLIFRVNSLRALALLGAFGALSLVGGCAQLHSYQLGEIRGDEQALRPFEFKVSELGVDLAGTTGLVQVGLRLTGQKRVARLADQLQTIISLFQFGPRTGSPVYSDDYTSALFELVDRACPSGEVSGLTMVRETRSYPVISGEIVKLKGFCRD